jgi:hypothetical protein
MRFIVISVIFYDVRATCMVASGSGKIITILGLHIKPRPTCTDIATHLQDCEPQAGNPWPTTYVEIYMLVCW